MADGYYSKLSQYIGQMQKEGNIVIDRNRLMDLCDLSEMSREELEASYKGLIASSALNEYGYRSVVKGEGLYLDYQNADNPIFLQKLSENADIEARQKKFIADSLRETKKRLIDTLPNYAQLAFNFDENYDSPIFEEISSDKLIEMLERMAV